MSSTSAVGWAAGPALSFGLEGTRREPANEAAVDHGAWVSTLLNWEAESAAKAAPVWVGPDLRLVALFTPQSAR